MKPGQDILTYRAHKPPESPTKRLILKTVMSVYDPIGFLAGWHLRGRLVLQQLWDYKLDWDDGITSDINAEWQSWTQELRRICDVQLARHVFQGHLIREVDLHGFCDASERGFAAVLFFRWDVDGEVHVSFVGARAKLAPTKNLSIPRLKLQAAVLLTRMISCVKKEAPVAVKSTLCWSDSKNVLAWVQFSRRRYHVFVSNRIAEIHDGTRPEDWRYVPTALNPADAASRGQSLHDLRPEGNCQLGARL